MLFSNNKPMEHGLSQVLPLVDIKSKKGLAI